MADYISREAAIEEIRKATGGPSDTANYQHFVVAVRKIPAADVVEVVRCKDCKHYNPKYEFKCVLPSGLVSPDYDDFCSKGERSAE